MKKKNMQSVYGSGKYGNTLLLMVLICTSIKNQQKRSHFLLHRCEAIHFFLLETYEWQHSRTNNAGFQQRKTIQNVEGLLF